MRCPTCGYQGVFSLAGICPKCGTMQIDQINVGKLVAELALQRLPNELIALRAKLDKLTEELAIKEAEVNYYRYREPRKWFAKIFPSYAQECALDSAKAQEAYNLTLGEHHQIEAEISDVQRKIKENTVIVNA